MKMNKDISDKKSGLATPLGSSELKNVSAGTDHTLVRPINIQNTSHTRTFPVWLRFLSA